MIGKCDAAESLPASLNFVFAFLVLPFSLVRFVGAVLSRRPLSEHLLTFGVFADSNAGSVTHLVSNEQPLAIAPVLQKTTEHQYTSQTNLNQSPVYSNILSHAQVPLSKSQSYANNLNVAEGKGEVGDLHLDPVVLRDAHIVDKRKDDKLDNDMTLQDKENSLLSASRLRLLQDTTMIESALDLDSLDDSSLGTNSQAGLMKVVV